MPGLIVNELTIYIHFTTRGHTVNTRGPEDNPVQAIDAVNAAERFHQAHLNLRVRVAEQLQQGCRRARVYPIRLQILDGTRHPPYAIRCRRPYFGHRVFKGCDDGVHCLCVDHLRAHNTLSAISALTRNSETDGWPGGGQLRVNVRVTLGWKPGAAANAGEGSGCRVERMDGKNPPSLAIQLWSAISMGQDRELNPSSNECFQIDKLVLHFPSALLFQQAMHLPYSS